jgi:hypothetical protein
VPRIAASVPVPIAIWRILRVGEHRDRSAFERVTFFAVFLLIATAACELVAFAVLPVAAR